MSLVFWLAHFARRNLKIGLGYVALAVFWISFEYFHYHWEIQWPWLTLGNGFANNIKLIQWYETTGVFGGSLWILCVNIFLTQFITNFKNTPVKKGALLISLFKIATFVFVPVLYSYYIYLHYTEKGEPVNIVLVQPNVNPYFENFTQEAENEKVINFIELAKTEITNETNFILGSETVVESYLNWDENHLSENMQFNMFKNFLCDYPNVELVFGASTSKTYSDESFATKTAREKDGKIYDVFNSAIFMNNTGATQIYHKSVLVSGVEKVPFANYFDFLKKLHFDFGGASGNIGNKNELPVFTARNGTKIAPVICFESVFGEYVADNMKNGAELIFILTNDGWWKNTPGYKQHLLFARLRAIETRRGIARASNTGVSCLISPQGDFLKTTKWDEESAVSGTTYSNSEITFYAKSGDYIARVALFTSILLLLFLLVEQLKIYKKKPH